MIFGVAVSNRTDFVKVTEDKPKFYIPDELAALVAAFVIMTIWACGTAYGIMLVKFILK